MRTLLIGALAATLAGCSSCPLPPQAGSCHGHERVRLLRQDGCPSVECTKASVIQGQFRAARNQARDRGEDRKAIVCSRPRQGPSRHENGEAHHDRSERRASTISHPTPASFIAAIATGAAADSDTTRANTADSRATDGAVPSPTTRTVQEQVAAATAVAERMTVAILTLAPEPNNKDRSDHSETVLRGDAEKTAPAQPNKTDLLVYLLMARPEIKSVSDLTSKIIAIDDGYSASSSNIRTAIVAAGASEVQLSNSQTKAIDRVVSGEVPAAVLTLVSPEAAEGFPEIAGFKIFRIPLSPHH